MKATVTLYCRKCSSSIEVPREIYDDDAALIQYLQDNGWETDTRTYLCDVHAYENEEFEKIPAWR